MHRIIRSASPSWNSFSNISLFSMRKAMMSHQQLATQWLRGQSLSPGNRHAAPHCRAGVVVHPNTSQALPIVFTGIQGEAIKSGERLSTVLTHKRKQSLSVYQSLRNFEKCCHHVALISSFAEKILQDAKRLVRDGTLGDDSCFSACWLPSVCTCSKWCWTLKSLDCLQPYFFFRFIFTSYV